MAAKKVTSQGFIGQSGANFVERVVLQMKYIWRPTPGFDVGIDGEIEICDPVTGEATNAIIKVQIKSTTKPFQAETSTAFEYPCEQKDLDYWQRGNTPIILIICRPDTNEAYWVSIKDYFKELATQKTRKVCFNKRLHLFDHNCTESLKHLSLPKDSGIYFSPLPKIEKLYTNLLEVQHFPTSIYVADTNYRQTADVWTEFKGRGIRIGAEWILTNKRIISFYNLEEPPFNAICDLGTLEYFDVNEWAYADDIDKRHEFVRLLNQCLRERNWLLGLRYSKENNYYYFPATKNLKTRRISYKSLKNKVEREVFKEYRKKSDPTQRAYCRHAAFKSYFQQIGDKWYLEITPTYHFSSNGYNEDKFRIERLKGIKRLERNPAVIGQLFMWADYLRRSIQSLFSPEYPFLSFGNLASVSINTGIPDDVWYQTEEEQEKEFLHANENQLGLLGL